MSEHSTAAAAGTGRSCSSIDGRTTSSRRTPTRGGTVPILARSALLSGWVAPLRCSLVPAKSSIRSVTGRRRGEAARAREKGTHQWNTCDTLVAHMRVGRLPARSLGWLSSAPSSVETIPGSFAFPARSAGARGARTARRHTSRCVGGHLAARLVRRPPVAWWPRVRAVFVCRHVRRRRQLEARARWWNLSDEPPRTRNNPNQWRSNVREGQGGGTRVAPVACQSSASESPSWSPCPAEAEKFVPSCEPPSLDTQGASETD